MPVSIDWLKLLLFGSTAFRICFCVIWFHPLEVSSICKKIINFLRTSIKLWHLPSCGHGVIWMSNPLVHFNILHFPGSFSWSPGKILFPSNLQCALHTPSMQPSARVFLITGTDDPKHNAMQGRTKSKIFMASIFVVALSKWNWSWHFLGFHLNTKNTHLHQKGQTITSIDNANFHSTSNQNDLVVVWHSAWTRRRKQIKCLRKTFVRFWVAIRKFPASHSYGFYFIVEASSFGENVEIFVNNFDFWNID